MPLLQVRTSLIEKSVDIIIPKMLIEQEVLQENCQDNAKCLQSTHAPISFPLGYFME